MNLKFSCVLDYSSVMAVQSYIWLNNLLSLSINPSDIYIHIIGEVPGEYFNYLEEKEINIIRKKVFNTRNKYCNKLVQLETFVPQDDFDYVFLMDCDTAIVTFDGLELKEDAYAKIVDFPNPPMEILEEIFEKAGLQIDKKKTTFELSGKNISDWNNCNGGVYIFSNNFIKEIAPKWIEYSKSCIDNNDLFTEEYAKHADQVGFALAMAELNKRIIHLGLEWNFPTHVPVITNIAPKIIHFHEKFDDQIRLLKTGNSAVDCQIEKVNFRIDKALKKGVGNFGIIANHPRDITPENLSLGFLKVRRQDLLSHLTAISRNNFGFFTSHFSRIFEYTWLFEQLEKEQGKLVLDIGAGVCPLPISLSQNGMQVYTVDSHSKIRLKEDLENWNEWGFLDYSIFDKNIISQNTNFLQYKKREPLDFIYSISVIEHIPKKDRLKIIRKASKLLKKGGQLLLTIDIIPETNKIWNLSEDKEVENPKNHGNIQSIRKELKSSGFCIVEESIQRDIPQSRTDVYYVKAELKRKSLFSELFN